MADKYAKTASKDTTLPISYSKISIGHLKHILHTRDITQWQTRWNNTEKGRHLHLFIPQIHTYITHKHTWTDFDLTQVLTGHGTVNSYFYRFKIKDSPLCPCDFTQEQTYNHLIYHCPLLTDYRTQLQHKTETKLNNWPVNEHELFEIFFKDFKIFCKLINIKIKQINEHYY